MRFGAEVNRRADSRIGLCGLCDEFRSSYKASDYIRMYMETSSILMFFIANPVLRSLSK